MSQAIPRHYLLASDFDQTLSFNDSGLVLSELIGASRFQEKVSGLARTNLVHQGGELAYLIRARNEERVVKAIENHLAASYARVLASYSDDGSDDQVGSGRRPRLLRPG